MATGLVAPLIRALFRPSLRGLENLPKDSAFLLVANHSAGIAVAELASFAVLYLERSEARLAAFALPIGFRVWPLSALHQEVGSIPSTYEAAAEALAAGVPILIFPGGDHEALRPIWRAAEVDFGGRQGFLRIAQRAGVPIVPMGIWGSHFTAPLLFRSRLWANLLVQPRLLGVKRWGLSLLGLLGAIGLALLPLPLGARALAIWLWLGAPLQCLPIIPARIRMEIGPPLSVAGLELDEALRRVEGAVRQAMQRARAPAP